MRILSLISAAIFASALLLSCKSYPPETQSLLSQIEQQNSQILRQEAVLSNAKFETSYLQEKNAVLSHEKEASQETLVAVCSSIRNVFLDMEQTLQSRSENLHDCFIGNAPVARQKILQSDENLLLVDLLNPAAADMMLMEALLYCHSPVTVTFCLLRQVPENPGTFEMVATGEELSATESGKQLFRFSGRSALLAKKGDFIGVLAAAGSKLSYDDSGTGNTPAIALPAVQRKMRLELADETSRLGRAFSWQLWGFKR